MGCYFPVNNFAHIIHPFFLWTAWREHERDLGYSDGYRFILVRILLTTCHSPRVDVVIYDLASENYQIMDLHGSDMNNYDCHPSVVFDWDQIETGYMNWIVRTKQAYKAKDGIERSAKPGKPKNKYKKNPDMILHGKEADPSHM